MIKPWFALMCGKERIYALNSEISGRRSESLFVVAYRNQRGGRIVRLPLKTQGKEKRIKEKLEKCRHCWGSKESFKNTDCGKLKEWGLWLGWCLGSMSWERGGNFGYLNQNKRKGREEEIKLRMFHVMCI